MRTTMHSARAWSNRLTRSLCALVSLVILSWTSVGSGQIPDYEDFANDTAAHSGIDSSSVVNLMVVAKKTKAPQGKDLPLALVIDIAPGWHIWLPEQLELQLTGVGKFEGATHTKLTIESKDNGIQANEGFAQWPEHHTFDADLGGGPQTLACFEERTIVYLPARVLEDAPLGPARVTVKLFLQSCNESVCKQNAEVVASLDLEIVSADSPTEVTDVGNIFDGFEYEKAYKQVYSGVAAPDLVKFDIFGWEWVVNAAGAGLYLLLAVAALGGFLLNLTPCVLPVIPIKIMGLSASAEGSRAKTFILGLALGAGVIGFWLLLGFLIAYVAAFTASNQLFQYPWFTITVGVFIAAMAVGMCGLFAIELPQSVYKFNPGHDSLFGSFLFGIMTAILSTPCTAPFMGAAAGWAATKTPTVTLMVFAAIGLGMALPYIILSAYPKLISRMPRTGPASELIKQFMGLLMLAAAAYFIGVGVSGLLVSPPNPPTKLYWWAVAAPLVIAGLWLVYRTIKITPSFGNRLTFGLIGLLLAVGAVLGAIRFTDKGPIDWTYYTHQRFDDALSEGRIVVLEFTAEWCINCKTLEETVLNTETVSKLMAEEDIKPIKIDLTKGYKDGNERLTSSGRITIPLFQVFAANGEEVFKSDTYTKQQVVEAIAKARKINSGGAPPTP